MKIASIITFLLSIAPLSISEVVSPEAFQSILDRMNKGRADAAIHNKAGNMHELRYDQNFSVDAMNQGTCEQAMIDGFFLLPDKDTYKKYGRDKRRIDYSHEIINAPNEESRFGWKAMQRLDKVLNDTRQSKIGCAFRDACMMQGDDKGTKLLFKFPMTCAVQYSIPDDPYKLREFIKKGPPGSQCPTAKNTNNLCVDKPIVPPKSGSPGTSGSSSSSSQLAPFILIALLIMKFL